MSSSASAVSYGASRSRSAWLQLDVEVVGHQPAVAAEDLRVVVALALERGGDLDRLHGAAEGAGEDAGDHLLEPVLEALQSAHVASFRLVSRSLS